MIKAVIFDCFGVVITDVLQAMCNELAIEHPDKAQQISELVQESIRGHIPSEESNRKVAELFGLSFEEYRSKIASGEVKDQALLNYIVTLRKNYKTAMLSNISSGGLQRRFTPQELNTYFDATVASSDIGFAKPEAQSYEIVADRLSVRLDECVLTDDREEYCEGAVGVGMAAIQYKSFAQFKPALERLLTKRM